MSNDPFRATSDDRDVPTGEMFNRQIRRATIKAKTELFFESPAGGFFLNDGIIFRLLIFFPNVQADKIIGGGQFGDVYLATQEIKVFRFSCPIYVV